MVRRMFLNGAVAADSPNFTRGNVCEKIDEGLPGWVDGTGMKRLLPSSVVVLLGSASFLTAQPVIQTKSQNALKIESARVTPGPNGGTYVAGVCRPAFGYSRVPLPHVHVLAFDDEGRLLFDKVDKLNTDRLRRSHRHSLPRDPYVVYLPVAPGEIGKVVVEQHSRHSHD